MIVLDTHIWIWWVHGDPQLPQDHQEYIQQQEAHGLGISAISCWEVAKLVERGRLTLPLPVCEWMGQALSYPGMRLLELSPQIAMESTQLPGTFHRDPADQISWPRRVFTTALWSRWTKTFGRIRTCKQHHRPDGPTTHCRGRDCERLFASLAGQVLRAPEFGRWTKPLRGWRGALLAKRSAAAPA